MNKYELEERTLQFSKNLIKALRRLPKDLINSSLIKQLSRAGTSIGANYREANAAESKKDFKHKINIVLKEATETLYWLDVLIVSNPELMPVHNEAKEFVKIFGKVISTCIIKKY